MKRRVFLSLLLLASVAALPAEAGRTRTVAQGGANDPLLPSVFASVDDAIAILQQDPPGPAFRVVVAAPRAAITGRTAGVLPAAHPGRTLNVVQGETVRFLSGLREAVWFEGRGKIESLLAVGMQDPSGTSVPLGRDVVAVGGSAPKIAHARAAVDVVFPDLGEFDVRAVVKLAAHPLDGRDAARARRIPYRVTVWAPGELGFVSGAVTDAAGGAPLPGFRVIAFDAGTLQPVSADITRWDGSYEIGRLPAGDYLVGVSPWRGFDGQFFDGASDPSGASSVSVTAGTETSGIDFTLGHP